MRQVNGPHALRRDQLFESIRSAGRTLSRVSKSFTNASSTSSAVIVPGGTCCCKRSAHSLFPARRRRTPRTRRKRQQIPAPACSDHVSGLAREELTVVSLSRPIIQPRPASPLAAPVSLQEALPPLLRPGSSPQLSLPHRGRCWLRQLH